MTIREAALVWGVSELTVRRRIKDGKIASQLKNGKYFVQERGNGSSTSAPEPSVPTEAPAPPPVVDRGDASVSRVPSIDLEAFVDEHRRLAEQAGRAALLEEQLRTLEGRYAQLQDGAVSLASRNGWLESKLDEREKEIKLLQDSRHRRSFWKRLFGG